MNSTKPSAIHSLTNGIDAIASNPGGPRVDLARYDNSWYFPGAGILKRVAWMFLGQPLFGCSLLPSSAFRVALLRVFGARIGRGVVIHSRVEVKYPWHLVTGDHCWIGEHVWIDNLTTVRLGSNVCISQAAYLCTGNHDWKDPGFGLVIGTITLADGAWAGARCVLLPDSRMDEGAVLAAGAVAAGTIPAYEIYAGNPATFQRKRALRDRAAPQAKGSEARR